MLQQTIPYAQDELAGQGLFATQQATGDRQIELQQKIELWQALLSKLSGSEWISRLGRLIGGQLAVGVSTTLRFSTLLAIPGDLWDGLWEEGRAQPLLSQTI